MQSPSRLILEPKKMKFDTVSTISPSICHEVMGLDAMIFIFWMLSQLFHSPFSPLSRGSLDPLWLSVIKVVSSAYLRLLLIFLPAVLIPACASSGMAFCMMYSACFPGGSDGKASVYNAGDPGLIPGLGRYSGEGNGNPLLYSCLENPVDGGAL